MTFDIRYDTKDIYVGHAKKQTFVQKNKNRRTDNPKTNDDDKPLTLKNVKKSDSDYIKKRRNELHLSQKDLAIKCNINVKVIQDYENGTAIVSDKILANIKRQLK